MRSLVKMFKDFHASRVLARANQQAQRMALSNARQGYREGVSRVYNAVEGLRPTIAAMDDLVLSMKGRRDDAAGNGTRVLPRQNRNQ